MRVWRSPRAHRPNPRPRRRGGRRHADAGLRGQAAEAANRLERPARPATAGHARRAQAARGPRRTARPSQPSSTRSSVRRPEARRRAPGRRGHVAVAGRERRRRCTPRRPAACANPYMPTSSDARSARSRRKARERGPVEGVALIGGAAADVRRHLRRSRTSRQTFTGRHLRRPDARQDRLPRHHRRPGVAKVTVAARDGAMTETTPANNLFRDRASRAPPAPTRIPRAHHLRERRRTGRRRAPAQQRQGDDPALRAAGRRRASATGASRRPP